MAKKIMVIDDSVSLRQSVLDFVPIIMLTTESSEKKREAGHMAGAKAWVVKPFRPEQILHAVSKLVS